ncbi:MAG: aldehyde dehydrogenase family protein [Micromonosporaceae bacterium]
MTESPTAPGSSTLAAGRWTDAGEGFGVLDKYRGDVIAEVPATPAAQVQQIVDGLCAATAAEPPPPAERAAVLRRAADLVAERRAEFAALLTAEAGFTQGDADNEIDRACLTLRLCAEEATRLTGETVDFSSSPGQHRRLGFTLRAPIGVVCAITPFNSPLNTVIHKIGPALAGGNAVVLKPSELTPLTAGLLCRVLLDAGQRPELLALVNGAGKVGEELLAHQGIGFYSFTGSTAVGRRIRAGAGLRRVQLELGSIASTIVCADADLDRAVPKIANAAFRKAGQVCTSTQRLYVERPAVDDVVSRLIDTLAGMPAGDPRDPETRIGPLISDASAARVSDWVDQALESGASVGCGGRRHGPVYQPTVLLGAAPGMAVVDQEVFGPVVSVLPYDDLDTAVASGNDTPYGLAAGIFTRDVDVALRAARALRVGTVNVNEASSARADAMPFGGVKSSGQGREGPAHAIREVTEERLVTLNP